MRPFYSLLLLFLLAACKPKPLPERVVGTWLIDHYDEYSRGISTGHSLDRIGYIHFGKDGSGSKKLSPEKQHGSMGAITSFRWMANDSTVRIMDVSGREVELWLVTSNYPTYMEWVSVNEARDSVRTMYLMKR